MSHQDISTILRHDPLLQGQRQGILLRRLLTSRTEALLDKVILGLFQGTFRFMALDVFAAISDQGTIRRARPSQAARALKADAVPGALTSLVDKHRRDGHLLNPNMKAFGEAPRSFSEAEMLRIAHFLRTRSAEPLDLDDESVGTSSTDRGPKGQTADVRETSAGAHRSAEPAVRNDASARLVCRHCGSLHLKSMIGRWGPYGQCSQCDKNTSVRPQCPKCGTKIRVERDAFGFAGRCDECRTAISILVGAEAST